MKLVHLISMVLVVLGGLHFALLGVGVNLLGMIFGSADIAIIHVVIGVAILHHVLPVVKSRLAAL